MNNNNNSGNSFKSFLLGALIGGAAVYLLGTKKGRKLLQTVVENGLEGASEIEELLEENYEEEIPPAKKEESSPPVSEPSKNETQGVAPQTNGELKESTVKKVVTTGKRFFKRIPKKV